MKTAMTITPPGGQLQFVAKMKSLDALIEVVAGSGFDAVELAIRDPQELNPEEIEQSVRRHGVELCVVGTGQSYVVDKLSFTSSDADNRKKAIQRYINQARFAGHFGANNTLALSLGVIEPGVEREQALGWAVEALEAILAVTESQGTKILLEPINRYETNFINTIEQAMELNAKVGGRLKVLYDTFHMNIEAPSMAGELLRLGDQLGHVHTADSNRWAPGFGHINFQEILHCLRQMGYDQYLSAEILPLPTVERSIEVAGRTLSSLLAVEE